MKDFYTIKFNFKGGVVSPGVLKKILFAAKKVNISSVKIGLRQQLTIKVPHHTSKLFLGELKDVETKYYIEENFQPNIVSSYVSEAVFQKSQWVSEGIYKDIFDSFLLEPKLKINISDNSQSFSPFFSGHFNFISSDTPNFWYFFLRIPKTNQVFAFQDLVYTQDIFKVAQILENEILIKKNLNPEALFDALVGVVVIPKNQELVLPRFSLPYYEGFNRYETKTWLGLYYRWESYSVDFLAEICELCLETKIGEICLTPWKSIIIKNILDIDRYKWSALLSKFNINVRHAANELNWQVEDDSNEALVLKMKLAEFFNHIDLRTFGICFGLKFTPKTEVYASIMVRRRRFKIFNFLPTFYVYDISYTEDFDPNGRTKKYFSKGISRLNLKEQLRRAVIFYNQIRAMENLNLNQESPTEFITIYPERSNHRCNDCLMVYDEKYGDELAGIPSGIIFENLPDNYQCGVCGNPKENFNKFLSPAT